MSGKRRGWGGGWSGESFLISFSLHSGSFQIQEISLSPLRKFMLAHCFLMSKIEQSWALVEAGETVIEMLTSRKRLLHSQYVWNDIAHRPLISTLPRQIVMPGRQVPTRTTPCVHPEPGIERIIYPLGLEKAYRISRTMSSSSTMPSAV